jgi:hypothetical protein
MEETNNEAKENISHQQPQQSQQIISCNNNNRYRSPQKNVEQLEKAHDDIDMIINHAKKHNHSKEVLERLERKKRKLSTELFDAYIYGDE